MAELTFTGRCAVTLQDKTVTPIVTVGKTLKDDTEDGQSLGTQYTILLGFIECLGCNKVRECEIMDKVAPEMEKINGRGDSFLPIY